VKKILEKARVILRNVYAVLGATVLPVMIHAMYGMREPDRSSYTVPLQGRVVSEETGEPVAGIMVEYVADRYVHADTDSDGRFLIYLPESDSYPLRFWDMDGFEGGGFFTRKDVSISRDEIGETLELSLYRERQAAVIRGTVLAKETDDPVPGVSVFVYSGFYSRFEALADDDGQFYIQVPERDTYRITFYDKRNLFQWKELDVNSDEIKDPLSVVLEKRPEEEPKEETGEDGE
jgi:hypothetical protein